MDPRMQYEDFDGEEGYSVLMENAELAEKMVDADFFNSFEDLYDVEDLD